MEKIKNVTLPNLSILKSVLIFNFQGTIKSYGASIAYGFMFHVKGMSYCCNKTIEPHFCDSTTIHHYPLQNILDLL